MVYSFSTSVHLNLKYLWSAVPFGELLQKWLEGTEGKGNINVS